MLWRYGTYFSQHNGNAVIAEKLNAQWKSINLCIRETRREANVFLPLSGKLTWNTNYVYWRKKDVYNSIKFEAWQSKDL